MQMLLWRRGALGACVTGGWVWVCVCDGLGTLMNYSSLLTPPLERRNGLPFIYFLSYEQFPETSSQDSYRIERDQMAIFQCTVRTCKFYQKGIWKLNSVLTSPAFASKYLRAQGWSRRLPLVMGVESWDGMLGREITAFLSPLHL